MIIGDNSKWIKNDYPHRAFRKKFTSDVAAFGASSEKILYSDYVDSYKLLLHDIIKQRKHSFESTYRRLSDDFSVQIIETGEIIAKIEKRTSKKNDIIISLGLLMSIEDAAQSVCSDIRSSFAKNSENIALNYMGLAPDVVWAVNHSEIIDPFRYSNYSPILEVSNSESGVPLPFVHKFVSISKHRQSIADLISDMAIVWITAHEDAHDYLGHLNYFFKEKTLSSFPEKMDFFNEFVRDYKTEESMELRLSAELAADTNASFVLVDHFAWSEVFDHYPFLYDYLKMAGVKEDSDPKVTKFVKTQILFRICMVAVTICLSIFERVTIKNSHKRLHHPELGTRILNCIVAVSGRINSVADKHSNRELSVLVTELYKKTFDWLYDDIDIVLKYMFEIGFVLKDNQIKYKNVNDFIDVELSKRNIKDLIAYLGNVNTVKYIYSMFEGQEILDKSKINAVVSNTLNSLNKDDSEVNNQILDYIEKHNELRQKENKNFLDSRMWVQKYLKYKVRETHEEQETLYEDVARFVNIMRKNNSN